MAITCPRCGAGFDVTLFQFGHRVQCDCGHWVDLAHGHRLGEPIDAEQDGKSQQNQEPEDGPNHAR